MAGHPLVIGVSDLLHHPGERREVTRSVVLDGLAISGCVVPAGEPVEVALEVECIGDDIVVYGTIRAPSVGECRRCLGEVRADVECDVREVFQHHAVEGETYALAGDHLDLEPLVRDAVLLSLPLAPLCADGCLGPAPDEFPARPADAGSPTPTTTTGDGAGDEPEGDEPPRDPRWAALDQLRLE